MRQIAFHQFGGPDVLALEEAQIPTPAPGEVLVRMHTAAVNPFDARIREGLLPFARKTPHVLGSDGAGTLETDTPTMKKGTKVIVWGIGVVSEGTWRDYATAPMQQIVPMPTRLSVEEAAAVPAGFLTTQLALLQNGFKPGQTVLVTAAGGNVGNSATQLVMAQGGRAIATASNSKKAERAREQGFDVIDLSKESLADGVRNRTNGSGAHLVLDSVGGYLLPELLATLAQGGTIVTIGYVGGTNATLNLPEFILKGAKLVSFLILSATPELIVGAWDTVLKLLADGTVKPVVDRVFPLEKAAQAQEYLASRQAYGKVVLSISR